MTKCISTSACVFLYICYAHVDPCVRIQQRKRLFLLMPCLTRSALIKSSPEPRHLTDRNPLQKTTPEPSKHTRLPACKPLLQCKQTGIHLNHWQCYLYRNVIQKKKKSHGSSWLLKKVKKMCNIVCNLNIYFFPFSICIRLYYHYFLIRLFSSCYTLQK